MKQDVITLLEDLLRCGDFFYSAIELDRHIPNPIDGEEFEERIINILKKLKDERFFD